MTHPWLQEQEQAFADSLREGRVAQAYLLSGPAGTGKADLARQFMGAVLCLDGAYPACGKCRSCQLLESGAHPEGRVITFEPHPKKKGAMRTELVVDQIRDLITALQLTNTISRRKAAVIFPAEALNLSAANALLKTLEEPPGDAVLFLVSNHPSRLPATVRSRCRHIHVRLPETGQALTWLQSESGVEGGRAEAALAAAAGSPLGALALLQQDGDAGYRQLCDMLEKLQGGSIGSLAAANSCADIEPDLLWSWLSLQAADALRRNLDRPERAQQLSSLQQEADRNRRLLPTPVRKDLLLQDWLIQWARLGHRGSWNQ